MNYLEKFLPIFLIIFCSTCGFSQQQENPNFISGKINVPIIVDDINIVDHFLDDRRDSHNKMENVSNEIYTQLKNTPIGFYNGKSFVGSSLENKNNQITFLSINGTINNDSNLADISVHFNQGKKAKSGVCDYNMEYSYTYRYSHMEVSKGLSFSNTKSAVYRIKPNKNTTLEVQSFKSYEITKCPKREYSRELDFKKVNEDYLEQKLASNWPYFSFTINWNGKTRNDILKESLIIEKVRDQDINWEPPSTPYLREGIEAESNSIAVYYDVKGLKNSDMISKGMAGLLIADLSKAPGLKIIERVKIDKIIQEIELSESGLVKEETKVENKLLKEEMSIIVMVDGIKKTWKCRIISKNKELLLSYNYSDDSYVFAYEKELARIIIKEANEQFDMNIDPNVIY